MILTWNKNSTSCRVANHNQMMEINERPDLDFNFDSIYLRDDTAKKEINGETYNLTKREKGLCIDYIRGFSFPDIAVNVVGVDGFYKGNISVKDMEEGDVVVSTTPPAFDYVYENEKWEKILLIIDSNGTPVEIKQSGRPSNIAIVFTESNKPYRMPKANEKWNFVSEKWEDTRDLYIERISAKQMVREVYDGNIRAETDDVFASETFSYILQLDEARAYQKDPKAEVIFLDNLIEERDDCISKKDLSLKIIKKDKALREKLAKSMGRQRNLIKKIEVVKSLNDLDTLMNEFHKLAFEGKV